MNIILLGKPGAGKGYLANYIKENYGLIHISTGKLLREEIKNNTILGKSAKEYIDLGKLVPDELVINIIKNYLINLNNSKGIIFDGFPRNISQAEELEKIINIDYIINVDVSDEILVDRILSRTSCELCGKEHNFKLDGKLNCDCGGNLIKRNDDNKETIIKRLDTYNKETKPLIDYYSNKNGFYNLDNSKELKIVINNLNYILSNC